MLLCSAWGVTLASLKEMPKSVERDFYIWQFLLDPKSSKEESLAASKLVFRVNDKLSKALYAKSGMQLTKKRKKVSTESKRYYLALLGSMHKSGDFFNAWLQLGDREKLKLFTLAGTANRALLNRKLEQSLYSRLTKDYSINEFLFRVERERLDKLSKIAHAIPPVAGNKINYNNLLKLGFDNLKSGNENLASTFFKSAIAKAQSRFYKDKAIFWSYLTSRNSRYLTLLANSYDYNIYKLIALDKLHKPYPTPATATINSNAKSIIDISDPIAWARLKKKIFSKKYNLYALAKEYNSKQSAGYYYYILTVASKHTKQYFPLLYRDSLSAYPVERQAMILALARQESHFIPASVSRSFALGMMQFMPFLIKHIAKERGEKVSYFDIFNPKVSLSFANTHLNYLYKYIYHPLFIAYAYNAGIGYTRGMLRTDIFKRGKYEPYLSLEMVDNDQANHYGKKVLANYVIYRTLLGSPVRVTQLLEQLDKPSLTDRFRKPQSRN